MNVESVARLVQWLTAPPSIEAVGKLLTNAPPMIMVM